ncbi:helix-turn-helix domain-containing protein [Actinocorallia longicatena]|uniref:TetR/AcrR family transcriptional regulator n=1 Tax=Actinocorallia longicatena TaxID=111803 RepID=A0ABP6Q5T5_9ACTN
MNQAIASGKAQNPTAGRILDAAERCMSRYGLERVSMLDVAREAEVSRGSVYRYFPTRDDLVHAVLARTARAFVEASEPVVDRGATLVDQVAEAAAFVAGHREDVEYTLRLPGGTDSLLAMLLTVHLDRFLAAQIDFWRPRLAAARLRGEIRAGLDEAQAGEWLVRIVFTFAVMPSAALEPADPDAVRAFVRTHLGGLQ